MTHFFSVRSGKTMNDLALMLLIDVNYSPGKSTGAAAHHDRRGEAGADRQFPQWLQFFRQCRNGFGSGVSVALWAAPLWPVLPIGRRRLVDPALAWFEHQRRR